MLQKLCDNCKKEIDFNISYYDESTFNLIINIENEKEQTFSGDLCADCEKSIVEKIKDVLNSYNIKEEKPDIIETEEETEEENFEMKLIEDKQNETT